MTIEQIDNDVYVASQLAFKASTPDRRLAGAEWLKQLAAELVELIKSEQPQPLADAFDEQAGPGDGWRWLKPGEGIQESDMVKGNRNFFPVVAVAGCEVAPDQHHVYRRRI